MDENKYDLDNYSNETSSYENNLRDTNIFLIISFFLVSLFMLSWFFSTFSFLTSFFNVLTSTVIESNELIFDYIDDDMNVIYSCTVNDEIYYYFSDVYVESDDDKVIFLNENNSFYLSLFLNLDGTYYFSAYTKPYILDLYYNNFFLYLMPFLICFGMFYLIIRIYKVKNKPINKNICDNSSKKIDLKKLKKISSGSTTINGVTLSSITYSYTEDRITRHLSEDEVIKEIESVKLRKFYSVLFINSIFVIFIIVFSSLLIIPLINYIDAKSYIDKGFIELESSYIIKDELINIDGDVYGYEYSIEYYLNESGRTYFYNDSTVYADYDTAVDESINNNLSLRLIIGPDSYYIFTKNNQDINDMYDFESFLNIDNDSSSFLFIIFIIVLASFIIAEAHLIDEHKKFSRFVLEEFNYGRNKKIFLS